MKILIFAGAGTSIELGVPGMTGLASDFQRHVRQWEVQPDIVDSLMGSVRDLERLIEKVDQICDARDSLDLLELDMSQLGPRVATVRREVEWFVQHAAERIAARDANLMWGPVLRCSKSHQIVFVTTNYDRAIEVAANAEGLRLDDGFAETSGGETAPWIGFERKDGAVKLIKLHGSTDWYRDKPTRRAIKLRHPMPLFADGTLVFGDRQLGAALVLPSREKILTREPYPWLSHEFLGAGDGSEIVVFVGSSLGDPHISQAAEAWAEKTPVFVITPDGQCQAVSGANVIRETASEFLISTLPNALGSHDPVACLKRRCHSAGGVEETQETCRDDGILSVVRAALGEEFDAARRCGALGQLVDMGATLPLRWVKGLINEENPALARHALGLIMGSSEHEELMRIAKESPHMGDRPFHDEYGMLREVMVAEDILKERQSHDR